MTLDSKLAALQRAFEAGALSEELLGTAQSALIRAECDALFRSIDVNGDGLLTEKEIKGGVDAIKAVGGLSQSAKKIWKAAELSFSMPSRKWLWPAPVTAIRPFMPM